MPSKKPIITLIVEESFLNKIDDYRFENRIANRSEAVRQLVEAGLKAKTKIPKKKN